MSSKVKETIGRALRIAKVLARSNSARRRDTRLTMSCWHRFLAMGGFGSTRGAAAADR
jgi:hypothetical protein